jgi:hypothetical protein
MTRKTQPNVPLNVDDGRGFTDQPFEAIDQIHQTVSASVGHQHHLKKLSRFSII